MTWQTLGGQKPLVAERLRRLRDELAAREAEVEATPVAPKYDHSKPLIIGKPLRAYLDKLVAETAEAEKLAAEEE